MNIIINKHLFAAYCGMLKSGYDLMDLSDIAVSNVHGWVSTADFSDEIAKYFLFTKTNTVSVNPYYPLGSDLSAACFFQDKSLDEYIDFLKTCESPEACNPTFTDWIAKLPSMLQVIENHSEFNAIYQSYRNSLLTRFAHVSEQISEIEKILKSNPFNTPVSLIFAPNLLQSKFLADYVLIDNSLYVISSTFQSSTIIHEYLHLALKPARPLLIDIVLKYGLDRYVDVNKILELGYLRGTTPNDKAYVLDELLVRALCGFLDASINVPNYCSDNVQVGFHSIPQIIANLSICPFSSLTLRGIVDQALNII